MDITPHDRRASKPHPAAIDPHDEGLRPQQSDLTISQQVSAKVVERAEPAAIKATQITDVRPGQSGRDPLTESAIALANNQKVLARLHGEGEPIGQVLEFRDRQTRITNLGGLATPTESEADKGPVAIPKGALGKRADDAEVAPVGITHWRALDIVSTPEQRSADAVSRADRRRVPDLGAIHRDVHDVQSVVVWMAKPRPTSDAASEANIAEAQADLDDVRRQMRKYANKQQDPPAALESRAAASVQHHNKAVVARVEGTWTTQYYVGARSQTELDVVSATVQDNLSPPPGFTVVPRRNEAGEPVTAGSINELDSDLRWNELPTEVLASIVMTPTAEDGLNGLGVCQPLPFRAIGTKTTDPAFHIGKAVDTDNVPTQANVDVGQKAARGHVAISGKSGAGKTTLVKEMMASIRENNPRAKILVINRAAQPIDDDFKNYTGETARIDPSKRDEVVPGFQLLEPMSWRTENGLEIEDLEKFASDVTGTLLIIGNAGAPGNTGTDPGTEAAHTDKAVRTVLSNAGWNVRANKWKDPQIRPRRMSIREVIDQIGKQITDAPPLFADSEAVQGLTDYQRNLERHIENKGEMSANVIETNAQVVNVATFMDPHCDIDTLILDCHNVGKAAGDAMTSIALHQAMAQLAWRKSHGLAPDTTGPPTLYVLIDEAQAALGPDDHLLSSQVEQFAETARGAGGELILATVQPGAVNERVWRVPNVRATLRTDGEDLAALGPKLVATTEQLGHLPKLLDGQVVVKQEGEPLILAQVSRTRPPEREYADLTPLITERRWPLWDEHMRTCTAATQAEAKLVLDGDQQRHADVLAPLALFMADKSYEALAGTNRQAPSAQLSDRVRQQLIDRMNRAENRRLPDVINRPMLRTLALFVADRVAHPPQQLAKHIRNPTAVADYVARGILGELGLATPPESTTATLLTPFANAVAVANDPESDAATELAILDEIVQRDDLEASTREHVLSAVSAMVSEYEVGSRSRAFALKHAVRGVDLPGFDDEGVTVGVGPHVRKLLQQAKLYVPPEVAPDISASPPAPSEVVPDIIAAPLAPPVWVGQLPRPVGGLDAMRGSAGCYVPIGRGAKFGVS